jgi:hypothetical protein
VLGIILIIVPLLTYFVVLPLIFYFTYRIHARPSFEVFDPASGMLEEVREYFDHCFAEFTQLQFQHLGTYAMPHATKNFKTLFALYERQADKVTATTTATFVRIKGEWRFQSQFTTLGTDFADGEEINTMNQARLVLFPPPEGSVRFQYPKLGKVADLVAAHKALVEYYRDGRELVIERETEYGGDPLVSFAEGTYKILEHMAKSGKLRLKQLSADPAKSSAAQEPDNPYRAPAPNALDQGPVFVATLRGAFLIIWQNLFPIKQICSRIRVSRDRKTLANTGFRWPD